MSTSSKRFHRIIHSSNRRRAAGGDASLTYEGAYINRSGETNGSNKTISLKFTETVPTGSDYTTGITIEVTGDNGSNYETLDLGDTTQAVVNTNYVQYTLAGTVDTFQGLSGTEGHQVRISYDGSQSWNSGTITNVTTLTNASTVNLLDDLVEVWHMASVSAAIASANDMTNEGSATFVSGKLGNATQMSRTGPKYLSHADSSVFSPGDTNFTWSFWVKFDSIDIWQYMISKWNWSGGTNGEYLFRIQDDNSPRWRIRISGSNKDVTWGSDVVADTWYNMVGYYDTDNDLIAIVVNAGTPVETTSITGAVDDYSLEVAFGASSDANTSASVAGIMDEVALHSKVLSSDEITDLYNGADGKAYPYIPDYT